jgi:hypothetical protein
MTKTNNGYRVVYGETLPAWEQILPTMKEAMAFAKEHKSFGDRIFSIKKVVQGQPPQSVMAAILGPGAVLRCAAVLPRIKRNLRKRHK